MKRIVRLTERDLTRIVKRVIMEQSKTLDGQTITKLVINKNRMGSNVTLSNGETYNYSEGMGYSNWCKPGEYTGKNLPQYCSVNITLSDNQRYTCDSTGCKKVDLDNY